MNYFFLFYTSINKNIIYDFNIHKSNNISNLYLLMIIINNIKKGINCNIWNTWNNNPSVSLDILNKNNEYKKYYHIHHLFDWYKGNNIFILSYTNIKTCFFFFKNEMKAKNTEPLIPISITEFQSFSSLYDILYNKLGVTKNAYSLCFYELNGKIKTEEKYKER